MRHDDRQRQIEEAAYYKAQKRGFAGGKALEDWLAAEREVDAASGHGSAVDDGTPIPAQIDGNSIPAPFAKEEALRSADVEQSAAAIRKSMGEPDDPNT